jgi:hypothetical protein
MADPVAGGVARVKSPNWYANRCCANWFPGPTPAMRADLEAMAREILNDAAAVAEGVTMPGCDCHACTMVGGVAAALRRAAGGEVTP